MCSGLRKWMPGRARHDTVGGGRPPGALLLRIDQRGLRLHVAGGRRTVTLRAVAVRPVTLRAVATVAAVLAARRAVAPVATVATTATAVAPVTVVTALARS